MQLKLKKISFEIGIFKDEEFKLLSITFFENYCINEWCIFGLQIGKFFIGIYWN